MYRAFAEGDMGTVLAALDPEIEWQQAEHGTFWPGAGFIGPDAVVQGVFMRIPETFGDTFRIDIERMHGSGDTVIMEGRYVGTVTATGKDLSAQVVHVWDLRDDKVVKFQQYTDSWQFAEVTGIAPVTASISA